MAQRRWTLRGGDLDTSILLITSDADRLDILALELSTEGYYTFVATPEAVAALVAVTNFDLVVVLADVTPEERVMVAQLPLIESRLLTIEANDDWSIGDRIRARLAH